jgi:hypothetical protein
LLPALVSIFTFLLACHHQHTSASVIENCICQHTSAYVSICQHTSAYVSVARPNQSLNLPSCLSTSALCQHMSAYAAYVSIRQHTSAYVSMRQHT